MFINENFIPVEANIKQHPAWFHRFDAVWTPTVLIMDSSGIERWRLEGYLPRTEFQAWLQMGLGRVAFMHKSWQDAEQRYAVVIERFARTFSAPEAVYWRGVCQYKKTNDHTVLAPVAEQLRASYPDSLWAVKASVWLH